MVTIRGLVVTVLLYLTHFSFPDSEREFDFFLQQKRTCHDTYYPFQTLSKHGLTQLDLEPVTILYGGNGCGKTTAINVIAETLGLARDTRYNRSNFFEDYTALCHFESKGPIPTASRVITSDDVFDYMLNLRALNEGIDERREELFQEYLDDKYSDFKYRTLEDYEQLKRVNLARRSTQSAYTRKRLMAKCAGAVQWRKRSLLLHQPYPGRRPLSAGRAGKQPLPHQADGAAAVPGGFRPVLRMPVCDCNPFAVPAFPSGCEDL